MDNDIYETIKERLSYSRSEKGMKNILLGVKDINRFMEEYGKEDNKNEETITGYDCVEYDLDL